MMSSSVMSIDSSIFPDVNRVRIPKHPRERQGRCYELSAQFMFDNEDWILVHATLYPRLGKFADREYKHAFVEQDWVLFDPVFNKFYVKEQYYEYNRVTDAKKYTIDEMCKMMLKKKTYGDWE